MDSRQSPYLLRVTIKQSKTDPFYQDVHLFLGKTITRICPVTGMLPYLAMRGAQAGPLFITTDRKQLTWQLLSSNLKPILQKMKINASQYNIHSFCIGAATSAKETKISDTRIQMLGRWKSQAYLQYIGSLDHSWPHYPNNLYKVTQCSKWTDQHACRIEGKFGEFGKSFVIRQTKPSKLVLTINNLLADLLICQTFF